MLPLIKILLLLAYMTTCLLPTLVNAQGLIQGATNAIKNSASLAVDLGGVALETGMDAAGGLVSGGVEAGVGVLNTFLPIDMITEVVEGVGDAMVISSDIIDPNN